TRSSCRLLMQKFYRNKTVISGLALLFVFLFRAEVVSAAHRHSDQFSYHTRLGNDLDGDHIPETATIRQNGSIYQVSIHFPPDRPKLRLRTYITGGISDLSFETTDVNNDSKGDLVLI